MENLEKLEEKYTVRQKNGHYDVQKNDRLIESSEELKNGVNKDFAERVQARLKTIAGLM